MSWNSGAGSPNSFMCHVWRSQWYANRDRSSEHVITLTGRTKPYRPKKYTALGARSTTVSREYRCSCGHVGWSNHKDLEDLEDLEGKG